MSGTVGVGGLATAEADDGGSPSDERVAHNQGTSLRWRPQFTQKPSEHVGLNRIDRYQHLFDMIARNAPKQACIELQTPRHDAGQYHRAAALRTFGAFDRDWQA